MNPRRSGGSLLRSTQGPAILMAGAVALLLASPEALQAARGRTPAAEPAPSETAEGGIPMSEAKSRAVDELALAAKRKAIASLQRVAKRYEGSKQEPTILLRLTESLQEASLIAYRVAHGRANARKTKPNLDETNNYLRQSVAYAGKLIQKYPRDIGIPRAHYLKAKAYKDLGATTSAIADYKAVADLYPHAKEGALATLALADLQIANRDYRSAAQYLNRLVGNKNSPFYPLAVDRLAWVHYYLNDVPTALRYISAELEYLRVNSAQGPEQAKANVVEKEKALANAVVFFSSAFVAKKPGFEVNRAVPYFKSLQPGDYFGKMVVQFAYFLRSKGFDAELEQFSTMTLNEPLKEEDGTEIRITTFENQLNKRRFVQMKRTGEDLLQFLKEHWSGSTDAPHLLKARRVVTNGIETIQAMLSKTRDPRDIEGSGATLRSLYSLMLRFPGNDPSTQMRLHFNLAEIEMQLRNYDAAAVQYRWIMANGEKTVAAGGGTAEDKKLMEEARMKALLARYENLRGNNQIYTNIKARPLSGVEKKQISPAAAEWIKWIEEFPRSSPKNADVHIYRFEAYRILYANGYIEEAIPRFLAFARTYPESMYAIPSASLVIDTYVASEDWDRTIELCTELAKNVKWKPESFRETLRKIAGDAYYKTVEALYKAKDFPGALARSESFAQLYPDSSYQRDNLALAANAALALNQRDKSIAYFERLKHTKGGLDGDLKATYLLTNASTAESQYDFKGAAYHSRNYLALPAGQKKVSQAELNALEDKTLLLAWLSGEDAELEATMRIPGVCPGQGALNCDDYGALLELSKVTRSTKELRQPKALRKALGRANGGGRASEKLIWAAIAMKAVEDLSFDDRTTVLGVVSNLWPKVDPLIGYHLLPHLSASIPHALRLQASHVRNAAPLKLDPKAIAKRTKLIEETEKTIEKVVALPWLRIQVFALATDAKLVGDFSDEILALPMPPGMGPEDIKAYKETVEEIRAPFAKKAMELKTKAQNVARESGVDDDASDVAFGDKDWAAIHTQRSGFQVVETVDIDPPANDPLRRGLKQAFERKNLPRLLFLLGEAEQKKTLPPQVYRAAKGALLSLAGAEAEAVVEFKQALKGAEKEGKAALLVPLIERFYKNMNAKMVEELIEDFVDSDGQRAIYAGIDDRRASLLVAAAKWAKVDVPSDFEKDLRSQASRAGVRKAGGAQ